ncbi:MAG: hypothetical protein ABMA13_00770 [Chthoniobacteraceae bacterium]
MSEPLTPTNSKSRVREFISRHWQPKEIEQPTVDPDLKHLDGAQRSAEVVRYSILSLEWWLSPNGRLREWLRLNGKISSVLIIPAVLVVPLVTFIIWQVSKWMGWLVGIAGNLILFPLAALVAAGVTFGVVILLRNLLGK